MNISCSLLSLPPITCCYHGHDNSHQCDYSHNDCMATMATIATNHRPACRSAMCPSCSRPGYRTIPRLIARPLAISLSGREKCMRICMRMRLRIYGCIRGCTCVAHVHVRKSVRVYICVYMYIYTYMLPPPFSYLYRNILTKNRLSWAGGEATNTFQLWGPDF